VVEGRKYDEGLDWVKGRNMMKYMVGVIFDKNKRPV